MCDRSRLKLEDASDITDDELEFYREEFEAVHERPPHSSHEFARWAARFHQKRIDRAPTLYFVDEDLSRRVKPL